MSRKTRGIARGYAVKNGYRAAPILVALAVLFLSVLGMRSVVHAQALGTLEFKEFAAIALIATDPTTSTTDVAWVTTASTTNSVNKVALRLSDADLAGIAGIGTTSVAVKSTTDSVGFNLTLTENGTSSGVFTGSLSLAATSSSTIKNLAADHGDTITATYADASTSLGAVSIPDTISVDTEGPVISAVTPVHGTVVSAVTSYTADVVDANSGMAAATIGTGNAKKTLTWLVNTSADVVGSATVVDKFFQSLTAITNGNTIKLSGLSLSGNIYVAVRAADLAGNVSTSDSDNLNGSQTMAKITIDATDPTWESAFTGVGWDNVNKKLTFNNTTGMVLLFADNLTSLDAASVAATDFTVAGNTVTRADVYSAGTATSSITGVTSVDTTKAVFLTLGTAITPDAVPVVTLAGNGVTDKAGNDLTLGNKTPADRIKPTLTVGSITPTLAGSTVKAIIQVSSNEALKSDDITVVVTALDSNTALSTITADAGTNKWTVTTAGADESTNYSIYITGQDAVSNATTLGVAGDFDPVATASDVLFEGDVVMPPPRVTPAASSEPVLRDPFFITIDFSVTSTSAYTEHEGNEYEGDSNATVTLTSLTLDGADILSTANTQNNKKFLVAVKGISLGDHTVKVNAKDAAGNTLANDMEVKFKVVERPKVSIALEPGWNLISFPGDPADGTLATVFADTASVTAVVTYDPTKPGGFLSAVRATGGAFAGTLASVNGNSGYWVKADTFETVKVDIPALAAGEVGLLPPTIATVKGWNLIPVRDVVGDAKAGATIAASTYLASISAAIAAVYHYNTITNSWEFVTVASDNVLVGKSYWIYTTAAGTLVPAGVPVNP